MKTEMVFETLVCSPLNHLTRLIARENFIIGCKYFEEDGIGMFDDTFAWTAEGKIRKTSVRIFGNLADIRTDYLQNTNIALPLSQPAHQKLIEEGHWIVSRRSWCILVKVKLKVSLCFN
jgi:hypothetical protein